MNKNEFPQDQQSEKEPAFEKSPETVKDLMAQWAEQFETTEDPDLKKELSYKILKMTIALRQGKLDSEKTKIARFSDNTLGFYDETTRQISLGEDTLELPPDHFDDVTVHEGIHAGNMTQGRRVFDEGLTEWYTKYKLGDALGGFYEKEQKKAKKAFGSGTNDMLEAIEHYDYDKPTKLAQWYLEVELEDLLANADPNQADKLVAQHLKKIKQVFKEAVPDLYQHLMQSAFKFDEEAEKIIDQIMAKKHRAAA